MIALSLAVALSRFQSAAPLPGLPAITIDSLLDGIGVAHQAARAKGLQGRVLWIDGTANLNRLATESSIVELIAKIKTVGFNTVVFDVKPIVGYTNYPSQLTKQLDEWRGQKKTPGFFPLKKIARESKANGLSLLASLNAFSEGHTLFKRGPAYENPQWVTTVYEFRPQLLVGGSRLDLNPVFGAKPGSNDLVLATGSGEPVDGAFGITVDRLGRIVDGFDSPGSLEKVPTIPKGGYLVIGTGSQADRLRELADPGAVVTLTTEARLAPILDNPNQIPVITNPFRVDVRERARAFVREIVAQYELDGIVYDDRLRFAGLNADFSPEAKAAFESEIGRPVSQWPEDVFEWTVTPLLERGIRPGPLYDEWLAFRARSIRRFVREIRQTLDSVKPGFLLGVYSGSWYGEYATYGQNYGSSSLDAGFWFLSKNYRESGLAADLDVLMTGCYYPIPTVHEALQRAKPIGSTVEAAGYLTNRVVRDQTWSYAGISLDQFKGDPSGLGNALQAACSSTQGVMVFDLSHDIEPMWPVFERAFRDRKQAPHQTNLLREIRSRRASLDRQGIADPPVMILGGSSGVGF